MIFKRKYRHLMLKISSIVNKPCSFISGKTFSFLERLKGHSYKFITDVLESNTYNGRPITKKPAYDAISYMTCE